MTIRSLVAEARKRLRQAGVPPDEAELDARLLAEFVLGWTTERFLTQHDSEIPPGFEDRFESLVVRRAAREPFAYIVERQEFWGLPFAVTPAVLIPRPETELIVAAALDCLDVASQARIADVGTGSGCLAVAIAHERPGVTIVATDVCDDALVIARANARRLRVDRQIQFQRTDLLDGVIDRVDVVVSNPPYVRKPDRAGIQPEVRFEPPHALFAGADGLDVIRRLLPAAVAHLSPGGMLIFELGFGQAESVSELISTTPGLTMSELRNDLQQIPRVAIARRA